MKVTYQTCCGVDVHKSFLVATIVKTTGGIEPSYQKKRFSTFNNSILEFKQWLINNNCHDVCMESTGKYWIPVFNLLEDQINVTIANPKWVKAVKGNKDDTKDSKWIPSWTCKRQLYSLQSYPYSQRIHQISLQACFLPFK